MKSIEAFALKGEKNIFKNMFKADGDSSDSSMSDCESDTGVTSEIGVASKEHATYGGSSTNRGRIVSTENNEGTSQELPEHLSSYDDLQEAESTIELYHSNNALFTISMLQQKRKGIAHQLWPAATFLSRYLETNLDNLCRTCRIGDNSDNSDDIGITGNTIPENTNILELGAGIGLCGLVCSALKFKKVILTDLPVALDLLKSNIALNNMSDTDARVLSWGVQSELADVMTQFDSSLPLLVIAADCVYWEILFKPLYDTMKELITIYNAEIIISHVKRWKKDEKFFKMCRKSFVVELLEEVTELVPAEHTGVPTRTIKRIYRIKAK